MSKAKRKLKRAVGKSAKRPKPRRAKSQKRFITRTEARCRAERYVFNRWFKGAMVQDGATAVLNIYYCDDWRGKDVWVVYVNPEQPVGGMLTLQSSDVVLVCKRTGRVLYVGSAGDEG